MISISVTSYTPNLSHHEVCHFNWPELKWWFARARIIHQVAPFVQDESGKKSMFCQCALPFVGGKAATYGSLSLSNHLWDVLIKNVKKCLDCIAFGMKLVAWEYHNFGQISEIFSRQIVAKYVTLHISVWDLTFWHLLFQLLIPFVQL